ncbi:ion channel protein [Spirillospora sp. NPDC050679]
MDPVPVRRLLPLVAPALLVGIGSSLVLIAVSVLAEGLQHAVWGGASSGWRTFAILTCAGAAVGLVVWRFPGHAGPDPATEGMVAPPLRAGVVPGLLVATVLTLAGGVSLGPENPITAANIALAFALGGRLLPGVPHGAWTGLAAAGTIGAMFGTPVAAALILSETPMGRPETPLWDRLFAPLVAAGAGALTTVTLAQPVLSVDVPAYRGFEPVDALTGPLIALAACALGLLAAYLFPLVHSAFRRVRHPLPMLTLGGALLGVLGAVGGPLTLFKGLDEMKELAAEPPAAADLLLVIAVKLAALLVAASCGFRGGRIFPAVFTGVAVGLLACALVPSVPPVLAVTCGVLGILIAMTRQGWLSLFMAATVVTDIKVLPVLCVVALPVWLLASGRPEMQIDEPRPVDHPASP